MQKEERQLVLPRPIKTVYDFIKDPKNYLSNISGVTINNNTALFDVPGFGNISASITNLVENKRVVIYSKEINTSLDVNLSSNDENSTSMIITSKSDPDCGLFSNIIIKRAIPRLLDSLVDNLKSQKI